MAFSLRAWIRFLRLPNGLTVPGDVLVGAAIQTGSFEAILRPVSGVLAAYWFGMALNDLVDLPRDLRLRANRPLPSGQMSPVAGWFVAGALLGGALCLVPTAAMGILLLLIVAYTLLKETVSSLAPVLMALCRVMALWIGAGSPASPTPELWGAFVFWFAWIWLITFLARREAMEEEAPGFSPVALLIVSAAFPCWIGLRFPHPELALPMLFLWVWAVLRLRGRLVSAGRIQPAWIGQALRVLLPLQCGVLAASGALLPATGLLLVWPLLAWLSRRFPMS